MEKEKKKWEDPKLICLYRGRLEEAVLAGCKSTIINGPQAAASKPCDFGGWCSVESVT